MENWLILWCSINTAAIFWVAVFRVRKVVVHSGTTLTHIDKYRFKSRSKVKK